MTRLAIQKDVLRDLAIRSKNQCAFPGCDSPILNSVGDYIAELCHIESAEPGGPRFNPQQSDEERRSYDNLLFLCHQHHKETDDVSLFNVSRMKEIKHKHERLPEVVFNHDLLLEKIEDIWNEQRKLAEILQAQGSKAGIPSSYKIHTSWLQDAWTPDQGRFYEWHAGDGSGFKFVMHGEWLHIEQTLKDGAIAYYEVNEAGNVRESRMPYPINEYRVVIPSSLVLRKEHMPSNLGDRAIRTVLKWSLGDIVEHFIGNLLVSAECNARCVIDHNERTIRVLEPKTAQQ